MRQDPDRVPRGALSVSEPAARGRRVQDLLPPLALRSNGDRAPAESPRSNARLLTAAALAGLLLVSLYLRTRSIYASFWIDEGLSVGIASHPLFDIPGVLRQDGSPPLYYMVLHVWMDVFGSGEGETHGLSLLFALAAIPAGLWAGWSLFGRRVGLICAVLVAVNPFLTNQAQETRMYALAILLGLLATAVFIHAFVFGRRRYLPALAVLLAVMLYTHNWAIFFTAGLAAAVLVCLRETPDRRPLLRDAALAFGGALLLFAPWIPSLAYQATHTGAPWSEAPALEAPLRGLSSLLGGDPPAVALLLGGGAGLVAVVSRGVHRERTAVLAAITVTVGTLVAAWVFSQISPAWTTRYLSLALGPLLFVAAIGLGRAGRLGLVALALVAFMWASPKDFDDKGNVQDVSREVAPLLGRGDLVVSTHPERVPVLHYYLPPGLRYATPLGPVKDVGVMDWRDALPRLREARPRGRLSPLLANLQVGSRVLLVRPIISNPDDWDAPWTRAVRRRSTQWGRALDRDSRFVRIATAPRFGCRLRPEGTPRARCIGVRAVVYTKTEAR